MTVYEYVYCEDKELTEDFRDHIFENAFDEYVRHLPTTPITEHGRKNPVWTDGSEILCESEVLAKTIADMLDYITGECESHYTTTIRKKMNAEDVSMIIPVGGMWILIEEESR